MKSFHLHKSDGSPVKNLWPRKDAFGIQRGKVFRIFKKPIVLTVLVSLIVGLCAGAFSSIYFSSIISKELYSRGGEVIQNEQQETQKSIPDVVESVSPAVVSVIVSKYVPVIEQYYINPFEEFEKFFGQPFGFQIPQYREKGKELQEVGGGTGFIISSNGLIITNKHVVLDEEAEYTVLTNDGKKYPAPVLARDPVQDIAVLKISAPLDSEHLTGSVTNLPTVKIGDSEKLRIGQTVIAIGNALGEFRNTVSVGVISGLARTITAGGGGFSEQLDEVIQTDAAINKGNSGGPLLNLSGEVIGINTAMVQGAESIGFAIPINKAKKDISDIQTKGRISYPFLGVRYIPINKAIAEKNNLPFDYGILVIRGSEAGEVAVMPESAADKAGIVENDIILEIDNVKIDQKNTLSKLILKHNVGDKVTLKVYHQGKEKIVEAVLGEWK